MTHPLLILSLIAVAIVAAHFLQTNQEEKQMHLPADLSRALTIMETLESNSLGTLPADKLNFLVGFYDDFPTRQSQQDTERELYDGNYGNCLVSKAPSATSNHQAAADYLRTTDTFIVSYNSYTNTVGTYLSSLL